MLHVCVSKGNNKIGKILNINLPPVITCPKNVPCIKKCYALNIYKAFPPAKKAWDENLLAFNTDPNYYFSEIASAIKKSNNKEYFWWHTSGDIINSFYLNNIKEIATSFTNTKFLAFTKNTFLKYDSLPGNLVIIASQWDGYEWGGNMPKAYVNLNNKIMVRSFNCPGSCIKCKHCWGLRNGESVIFQENNINSNKQKSK